MIKVMTEKKYRETWIPGLAALLVMAIILTLLMITGYLFAADKDDQIETTARQLVIFKTCLKGNDIQIHSQDGVVTLTGTVAEESHLQIAAEKVADLPGVKRVDNLMIIE